MLRAWVVAAALAVCVAPPLAGQFPAELVGQVADSQTQRPLESVRVSVLVAGLVVQTDAAGRFRLRGLPPGEWEIEVAAIGYHPARTRVTLTDGRIEQVTVLLRSNPVVLPPIDVTATHPAPGAGTSVIDREHIEAMHAPDVPALLAGEPSVTITRHGGPGSPTSVSIRGSAPHEVLVLLDGVPLNDPTTGEVDLAALPLEQIERVTIMRGGTAARYGARALAGVIAIERRHPTVTQGSLMVAAGSWGERTARGALSVVRQRGARTLGASLSGGFTRFAGDFPYEVPPVRGGGTADRVNGDGRNNSLLGAVRVGGRRSLTELRADYLDVDRGLPGSIVQPTSGARQNERRLGAGLATRQMIGTLDWRGDLDASTRGVQYVDPAPPAPPPYDDSTRVRQFLASTEVGRTLGAVRLSLGAEGRWLGMRASSLTADAPTTQRVLSGWVRASAEPRLGRLRPSVSAGARVDHDDHSNDTQWSPAVDASIPVPGATLHASWAMAFAPPTLADQFFQPGVLAQPNPDLRPERVRNDWQLQLTFRTLQLGGVTASGAVSLFKADIDGMILWFPNFRYVWSPGNYDVRRRGGELSAAVNLPIADVSLTGNVSDIAVEYRGPVLSGQVAYRPRYTANASLAAGTREFRGSVRYRYIGRRRSIAGSDLNTLAPFAVTDLQIVRRVAISRASMEVAIACDDVLNRAGTMLIDYPAPGRVWRFTLSVHSSPTP